MKVPVKDFCYRQRERSVSQHSTSERLQEVTNTALEAIADVVLNCTRNCTGRMGLCPCWKAVGVNGCGLRHPAHWKIFTNIWDVAYRLS
jgi:hypothetical protein